MRKLIFILLFFIFLFFLQGCRPHHVSRMERVDAKIAEYVARHRLEVMEKKFCPIYSIKESPKN